MKKRLGSLLIIIAMVSAASPCPAQDHARRFIAAIEAYKADDYAAAIQGLEAIAADGVKNGRLFYDMGNAYLKSNDLGHAILWYERALTLMPNDPDLGFNYHYARSLTKDVQEDDGMPLTHIFFFWKYELSAGSVILLALAFNLLFWCLAILWRITRRRGLRKAAFGTLVPMLVLILTAGFNYYESAHRDQAIVLPAKIAVRSGLEPTSTELFELHAGAKVKVVRQMKDHLQIRFSEDKIGWVQDGTVGII